MNDAIRKKVERETGLTGDELDKAVREETATILRAAQPLVKVFSGRITQIKEIDQRAARKKP